MAAVDVVADVAVARPNDASSRLSGADLDESAGGTVALAPPASCISTSLVKAVACAITTAHSAPSMSV